jgi:hypothetical protein
MEHEVYSYTVQFRRGTYTPPRNFDITCFVDREYLYTHIFFVPLAVVVVVVVVFPFGALVTVGLLLTGTVQMRNE